MRLKRIRIDKFLLREIEGTATLFLDAKQIYPRKGKLKRKEVKQIIHTAENIVRFSPQAAQIQLDMSGRSIKGHLQAIVSELERLNQLKERVNDMLAKEVSENDLIGLPYRYLQAIPIEQEIVYIGGMADSLPISRRQLLLSKNKPLGGIVLFVSRPIPYLELDSERDLYRFYTHYLCIEKV